MDYLRENAKKAGWKTTKSGLQYLVLNYGPGRYHPALQSECHVHYELTLIDGSVVDTTYKTKKPHIFSPIQMIPGWTEALQLMVEGDKYQLVVPSDLGYGSSGNPPHIPSGAVLCFKMELVQVNGTMVDAGRSGQPMLTCNVTTFDGCIQKELDFVKAFQTKLRVKPWPAGQSPREKLEAEIDRLADLHHKPMSAVLKTWNTRRSDLLSKMLAIHESNLKKRRERPGYTNKPKELEWEDPGMQKQFERRYGYTEL